MKTQFEIGLSEHELTTIRAKIAKIPEVETVILFGSRGKGTHRRGSDVDLALDGPNLTRRQMLRLSCQLNEETLLPYRFHLLTLSDADEPFREHIRRVRVVDTRSVVDNEIDAQAV